MAKTRFRRHKKFFYTLASLALLGIVLVVLELTNTTHFFHKMPTVSKPTPAIKSLPAKSSPSNANKQPAGSSTFNQQTATDQNGQTPRGVSNDPNKWLISQSGAITVKLPTANSTFKPGDELYGSASVSKVQYRLIDNQVGNVSQGFISVVNGNFTASVNFKQYASSGRLDVFSTDSAGKELNEVQIPVNFQ